MGLERFKKILREYDPRLHKKEREIEGSKKILDAIEETRKKLKNIYAKKNSEKE